jgi:hypothetical protein
VEISEEIYDRFARLTTVDVDSIRCTSIEIFFRNAFVIRSPSYVREINILHCQANVDKSFDVLYTLAVSNDGANRDPFR